jgi:hypothetical protein
MEAIGRKVARIHRQEWNMLPGAFRQIFFARQVEIEQIIVAQRMVMPVVMQADPIALFDLLHQGSQIGEAIDEPVPLLGRKRQHSLGAVDGGFDETSQDYSLSMHALDLTRH